MNLYRRTFGVVANYWKQLATASVSAALFAIFSGLMIWMAGPLLMTLFQVGDHSFGAPSDIAQTAAKATGFASGLIDFINSLKEGMKGWIQNMVAADTRLDSLYRFVWLIAIVVVAKNFFQYMQGFFMAYVQQSVVRYFREKLFEKYQRLSLDYFHRRRTGQVISRITNDVIVLNESIDQSFNHLIAESVTVLVLFSFLVILSWKLTLVSLLILPVVFGFIWFIGRKLRKYSERSQERMADVNSVLEESITNIRVVKAFSMEKFETAKFFEATKNFFKALLRMTRIRHLTSPINDMLATSAGLLILVYAGTKIIGGSGDLDAGDFMTFLVAMLAMIKPVKSLSQIHVRIQEGMAAAQRIFEVLDENEVVTDPVSPKSFRTFSSEIKYDSVSFAYREGEPVVDNVSFTVKAGEAVALVGPSGGGKSTLMDLLPRFYDPQAGTITIDGINIRELTLSSLRSVMGIVTQETLLFNDTVRNNIAYGRNGTEHDRVVDAAKMANAHQFISEMENGYDTMIGNRGTRLSGGQRQRLAIARALLKDPQILIFDEATSALDTESEVLVQEAINRLMAGRTTLVVAHRLSTIKNADRILVIDKGKIIESGSHGELINSGGLYQRLYSLQFRDD